MRATLFAARPNGYRRSIRPAQPDPPRLTRLRSRLTLRRHCWGKTLHSRWVILAILFLVRFVMPFQFQSIAAVAPLLTTKFGVNIADIGLLIGLYFTPGIAL